MQTPPLLTVVVPVRNERYTLEAFFLRLHKSLTYAKVPYEIIAVDDSSDDGSLEKLNNLAKDYPITVLSKSGLMGKGYSLHEGLKQVTTPFACYIDADNAYSPEIIPEMLVKLNTADIVVAQRNYSKKGRWVKKSLAKFFRRVFGQALFGLDFDVQAGLKVFRTEAFSSLELHPSTWSLDLEFLYKAVHAGFVVESFPMQYQQRSNGKGKYNVFTAGIELVLLSIKHRLSPLKPVHVQTQGSKRQVGWKKMRFDTHTNLHYSQAAIQTLTFKQVAIFMLILTVIVAFYLFDWQTSLIVTISILTGFYFLDLLFNLYLIQAAFKKNPEIKISDKQIEAYGDSWPTYSIMCPLYKEWQVIPQFTQAISAIDYPKDKLDVMLILEEDDQETINKVKSMKLPAYFRTIIVPDAQPKTKPKACNYALKKAKGEYAVIYDAEDVPDPLQLKKSIVAFQALRKQNIVCLQAKLNYYNPEQNLLTRFFTAEYSLWFDVILPGMHSVNAPIPLGGTSNHFKVSDLKLLSGWDPFNVTEDCDLGMRLVKYGYRTMILDSTTYEEANSDVGNWFRQRSRWIKGYIQTYLVHMRSPREFLSDWNNPNLLFFQFIVGGKVLSLLINPIMWITTIVYFTLRSTAGAFIESLFIGPVFYLGLVALVAGNFMYLYYYMIGNAKREQWSLIKYCYLIPIYWLMMSISAWKAFYQIIAKPHYWEKTVHGLHLGSGEPITFSLSEHTS